MDQAVGFAPRGRNQLVRLLLENKLPDRGAAAEALETCLLCSACTTVCYAHVPVADIVLEGRRMLTETRPWLAKTLSRLLLDHRQGRVPASHTSPGKLTHHPRHPLLYFV